MPVSPPSPDHARIATLLGSLSKPTDGTKAENISWIRAALARVGYFGLSREDKGAMRRYLQEVSGYSRAQVERYIGAFRREVASQGVDGVHTTGDKTKRTATHGKRIFNGRMRTILPKGYASVWGTGKHKLITATSLGLITACVMAMGIRFQTLPASLMFLNGESVTVSPLDAALQPIFSNIPKGKTVTSNIIVASVMPGGTAPLYVEQSTAVQTPTVTVIRRIMRDLKTLDARGVSTIGKSDSQLYTSLAPLAALLQLGKEGQVLTIRNGKASWNDWRSFTTINVQGGVNAQGGNPRRGGGGGGGGSVTVNNISNTPGLSQADTDPLYVNVTGDTMSGPLTILATGTALSITGTTSGSVIRAASILSSSGSLTVQGAVAFRSLQNCAVIQSSSSGALSCTTGFTSSQADNRYVNVSGDTMTGALRISAAGVGLTVNGTMSGRSLFISGTGASPLLFTQISTGMVGIGTSNPRTKLEVLGTISGSALAINGTSLTIAGHAYTFPTTQSLNGQVLMNDGSDVLSWATTASLIITPSDARYVRKSGDTMTGGLLIAMSSGITTRKAPLHVIGSGAFTGTLSGSALNIQGGTSYIRGNLGIGKTSPLTALDVAGTISGSALTVSSLKSCAIIITDGNGVTSCGTAFTSSAADNRYVNVSGDTMTGSLFVRATVSGSIIQADSQLRSSGTLVVRGAAKFYSTTNVIGNATFDTNTLFVDAGNHRVGVLTTAPKTAFEVAGTASGQALTVSSLKSCSIIVTDANGVTSCGSAFTSSAADNRYVNTSGDTMTGGLLIAMSSGLSVRKAPLHVVGSGAFTGTLSGSALNIQGGTSYIRGNLGIKTTTPKAALHVIGSGAFTGSLSGQTLYITGTGSTPMITTVKGTNMVGMGTATPSAPLHVLNANTASVTAFESTSATADATWGAGLLHMKNTTAQGPFVDLWSSGVRWAFGVSSGNSFNIRTGGNTTDPVLGTTYFAIGSTGLAAFNNGTAAVAGQQLAVVNGVAGNKGLVVYGAASQTGNIFEIDNTSSVALDSIDATGKMSIKSSAAPKAALYVAGSGAFTGTLSGSALNIQGGASYILGNTRIGNATANASVKLDVVGTISGALLTINGGGISYLNGGNFGIKTTTPKAALGVIGSGAFTGTLSGSALNIQGGTSYILGNLGIGKTTAGTRLSVSGVMSGTSLFVTGTGALPMLVTQQTTGNVGIGTSAPKTKLEVVGTLSGTTLTISSMSSGSILFTGSGGRISQNNAALYWDNFRGSLGLNTTTPTGTLDVRAPNFLGLVGWWPMDEGTGTSTADSSPVGSPGSAGTLTSSAMWSGTGKFLKDVIVNGSQRVAIPSSSALNINGSMSFSIWANGTWASGGNARLIQKGTTGGEAGFGCADSNNVKFDCWYTTPGGVETVQGMTYPSANVWHMITVTWNGTSLKIYKDGVDVTTTASSSGYGSTTAELAIGNRAGNTNQGFIGSLDDTRIYNRALSAADVTRLYTTSPYSNGNVLVEEGSVGIGTAAPKTKLEVVGTISGSILTIQGSGSYALGKMTMGSGKTMNGQLNVYTTDAFNNPAMLIRSRETTGSQNLFQIISDTTSVNNSVFRINASGATFADQPYNSGGADYAEWFASKDYGTVRPGDLVCIDVTQSSSVKRCDSPADPNVMGIISTKPSVVGNAIEGKTISLDGIPVPGYVLVGLIGQIPANVTTETTDENGVIVTEPIHPGDSLTSADKPGFARKARPGESTVGVALEGLEHGDSILKVLIARSNKSITDEAVTKKVQDSVASLNIDNEIALSMQKGLLSLNLAGQVKDAVDQLHDTDVQRLTASLIVLQKQVDSLSGALTTMLQGQQVLPSPGTTPPEEDTITPLEAAMNAYIPVINTTVTGGLIVTDTLDAGALVSESTLNVSKDARIGGDLYLDGTLRASSLFIPNGLTVDGGLTVHGSFQTGQMAIDSGATVGGTLTVQNGLRLGSRSTMIMGSGSTMQVQDLLVRGALRVIGDVTFEGIATFLGDVTVHGELSVSNRQAGYAVIPAGQTKINVAFGGGFAVIPVVSASPDTPVLYAVSKATATGFVITIATSAQNDISFSWIALGSVNPQTASGSMQAGTTNGGAVSSSSESAVLNGAEGSDASLSSNSSSSDPSVSSASSESSSSTATGNTMPSMESSSSSSISSGSSSEASASSELPVLSGAEGSDSSSSNNSTADSSFEILNP